MFVMPYPSTQWAAVRIYDDANKVPPHRRYKPAVALIGNNRLA